MIASLFLTAFATPGLSLDPPTRGGRALLRTIPPGGRERSRLVADALLEGQIPRDDRSLSPLSFTRADSRGRDHRVTLWVTHDYLTLGTRDDQVYAPLDLPEARRVATRLGMVLPTSAISDRVYEAAQAPLAPHPIPPDAQMATTARLLEHQAVLEAQGIAGDGLYAGHKKDLVLTARLASRPDRVAIYGWHQSPGEPIQPVSLWHGAHYVDYSHGVRLVAREVEVDGTTHDLLDLLADAELAPLLSDEGPLPASLLAEWR